VAWVAALLMVVGCGSLSGGARVTPSPPSSPAVKLALTDADAGKTFQLHTGQLVTVSLHQPPGYTAWSGLHSTDTVVLAPRVDTRRTAVQGLTLGTFRAMAAGTAQLQATTGVACPPLQVCPALARVWMVAIQVS
jgi:hypothetical protein